VNILRRIGTRTGWLASGAAACGLFALLAPSFATPLGKEACAKLTQDMRNMKMLEVDKLMQNGATWAATHLSATDLNLVRQYIDLDEQLKFRCSAPSSLVNLKHHDDEDKDKESGSHQQAGSSDGGAKKGQAGAGQEAVPRKPAQKSKVERKAAKASAKTGPAHTRAQ
jgi:hypothetical protein